MAAAKGLCVMAETLWSARELEAILGPAEGGTKESTSNSEETFGVNSSIENSAAKAS
jgi:hypothetical protein